jgi:WD40 repeat protein
MNKIQLFMITISGGIKMFDVSFIEKRELSPRHIEILADLFREYSVDKKQRKDVDSPKHLHNFLEKYKNDNSIEAQTAVHNIMKILHFSKRYMPLEEQGLSYEHFSKLDLRRCSGMGYTLTNTVFDSCFINSEFFAQSAWLTGASDINFIPFEEQYKDDNGDTKLKTNSNKFLAYISEYGDFQIVEYQTAVLRFSRKVGWGFHDSDVINTTPYKGYILVSVSGYDSYNEKSTSVIYVFDKYTFEFLEEVSGNSVSEDIWEKLNPYLPFRRQPNYIGSRDYDYMEDEFLTEEYTIQFETRISNYVDDIVEQKISPTSSEIIENLYRNPKTYDSIKAMKCFCFCSDNYHENKLFITFAECNHNNKATILKYAVELQLDDTINFRLLKGKIITEDKRYIVAYQTNHPYIYVWSLPAGTLFRFTASEAAGYCINAIACSKDSKHIVVSGDKQKICTYDLAYGTLTNITQDNFDIECGCMLNDKYFAIGLDNGLIKIWNIETKKVVSIFEAHKNKISGIVKMNDQEFLSFSSDEEVPKIWGISVCVKNGYDIIFCSIINFNFELLPPRDNIGEEDHNEEWTAIEKKSHYLRNVSYSEEKIIALTWQEVIIWDNKTLKLISNVPYKFIISESEESIVRPLCLSEDGTYAAFSFSKSILVCNIPCVLQEYQKKENERNIQLFRGININTKFETESATISKCNKYLTYESGTEVYVCNITNDSEPYKLETKWEYSTFPVISDDGYDAPGDQVMLKSIDSIYYTKNRIVVCTRIGIVYFYDLESFELKEVRALRGDINAIECIPNTNTIVASDGQSIYIWEYVNEKHKVHLLPNANGGYVNCEIKDKLLTEDITYEFLYLLQSNGLIISKDGRTYAQADKDIQNKKLIEFKGSKEQVYLTNNLIGNTFSDYSDGLQVFIEHSDSLKYSEMALDYLRSLYTSPVCPQTIVPLTLLDGICKFEHQREKNGVSNWMNTLKEVFTIFSDYPKVKGNKSNEYTAQMMTKSILWTIEKVSSDDAYKVFQNYCMDVYENMPKNPEYLSILSNAIYTALEKQSQRDNIDEICAVLCQMYNEFADHSVSISHFYMRALFYRIKSEPQDNRFNTLDEMYRVYNDNKDVQDVYAYLFARGCDHFCAEYMMNSNKIHYFEMVVNDLQSVSDYYLSKSVEDKKTLDVLVEILFTLATYQAVLFGQKSFNEKISMPLGYKKMMNSLHKRESATLSELSLDDVLTSNPQLEPLRKTIMLMFMAYNELEPETQKEKHLKDKLIRIQKLLNLFFGVMR